MFSTFRVVMGIFLFEGGRGEQGMKNFKIYLKYLKMSKIKFSFLTKKSLRKINPRLHCTSLPQQLSSQLQFSVTTSRQIKEEENRKISIWKMCEGEQKFFCEVRKKSEMVVRGESSRSCRRCHVIFSIIPKCFNLPHTQS